MSNYSFRAHAASDRKKWVLVTIAILLLIAIVVLIITTNCFTDWNKYCIFGHDYDDNGVCVKCGAEKLDDVESDKPEKDKGDDVEANSVAGGGMATVLPGNGIRLLAAKMAPMAGVPTSVVENTWTLTANVNEHADDKYINWSVRWKDAQAAWAKSKTVTDYVTVTPTQAGALTATVKVIKDFGAQIEVVATSRDNPEKSATCVFDYVQKITGLTFNMPDISSESTSFTYEFQTTAYTVAADLKLELDGSKKMSVREEFREELFNCFNVYEAAEACIKFFDVPLVLSQNTLTFSRPSEMSSFTSTYDSLSGIPGYFVMLLKNAANNGQNVEDLTPSDLHFAFTDLCSSYNAVQFSIKYTATYQGKTYSTGSKTIEATFSGAALRIPVYDVTLSESHIYA